MKTRTLIVIGAAAVLSPQRDTNGVIFADSTSKTTFATVSIVSTDKREPTSPDAISDAKQGTRSANVGEVSAAASGGQEIRADLERDWIAEALRDGKKVAFARRFIGNASSLGYENIRASLRIRVNEGAMFAGTVLAKEKLARNRKDARDTQIARNAQNAKTTGSAQNTKNSQQNSQKNGSLSKLEIREQERLFAPDFVYAVFANEFFRRVSPADFRRMNRRDKKQVAEFLSWVFSNPKIFLEFAALGQTPTVNLAGDLRATFPWFSDWFELYQLRPSSRDGVGFKAALALAHANACGKVGGERISRKNKREFSDDSSQNFLDRYDWFMRSHTNKIFLRDMEKTSISDLRYILGTHFTLKELEWCQTRYAQPGFPFFGTDEIAKSSGLVTYRSRNAKGVHVSSTQEFYGVTYPTIESYVEHGGQCRAVSRTGAAFCAAAGVPVFLLGQPNHLAYCWKDSTGVWKIGNDIYGLNFSKDSKELLPWEGVPENAILYDSFLREEKNATESLFWTSLARSELPRSPRRLQFANRAVETSPKNLESLKELLALYLLTTKNFASPANDPLRDFLLQTGFSSLEKHPLILSELFAERTFAELLRNTRQKAASQNFRFEIYKRLASSPEDVVPQSAEIAQLRFFMQQIPKFYKNSVNASSAGLLHTKNKELLANFSPAEISDVVLELELLLHAQFFATPQNFFQNSANYFAYYKTLCQQHIGLRKPTVQFFSQLKREFPLSSSQISPWIVEIDSLPLPPSAKTTSKKKIPPPPPVKKKKR